MAKPTKYATLICVTLTVLLIIGIIASFYFKNPMIIVILMFPAVIYGAYRTEGKNTKWASFLMLLIIILELILLIFKVNFNLAEYFQLEEIYLRGNIVPLADIKIIAPAVLALLSIVLFTRTHGIYTKWLSVIIFLGSFSIVYLIDPEIFRLLLKNGIENNI